jgi:HAMP domain-containing protein
MRLSVRLMALGVTGPIVGLGIFLALSASTVVELAQTAKLELTTLFDQDNRTNLLLATRIIQSESEGIAQQLARDADDLRSKLSTQLTASASGQLFWQGQALDPAKGPELLNATLAVPLSIPTESSSIYYEDPRGIWRRLAGVDSQGKALTAGWVPPASSVEEMEAIVRLPSGRFASRNTMLHRDGFWRMTRLIPLQSPAQPQRMLLAVSVRTDAANQVLNSSAQLFPYKNHLVAFFGYDGRGELFCSFSQPATGTCETLRQAMLRSGGIPRPGALRHSTLNERALLTASAAGQPAKPQRLFIATFPSWNWVAVILVEETLLDRTLLPLRQATIHMLQLLVVATVLLLAGCATAAWRITKGIKQELRALASAADSIAAGDSCLPLTYPSDDALGRLVQAFNRMSGAVADREDSLKARIRTLEIDINEQTLHGQVCSITANPTFSALNERARQMRARRQGQLNPTSPDAPASATGRGDCPPAESTEGHPGN